MGVKHRLFHRYQPKQRGQLLIVYVKAQIHEKAQVTSGIIFFGEMSVLLFGQTGRNNASFCICWVLKVRLAAGVGVGGEGWPAVISELSPAWDHRIIE